MADSVEDGSAVGAPPPGGGVGTWPPGGAVGALPPGGGVGTWPPGGEVGAWPATEHAKRGTLITFIKKLARRRRRIPCSALVRELLRTSLAGKAEDGRVLPNQLMEVLARQPGGVSTEFIREVLDTAKGYQDSVDGLIDVQKLLAGAFRDDAGVAARIQPILPSAAVLIWLSLAPALFGPVLGLAPVDGWYLAVMTISTVGAADIGVTEASGKLCLMLYALIGVGLSVLTLLQILVGSLGRLRVQMMRLLSARDSQELLRDEMMCAETEDLGGGTLGYSSLDDLTTLGPSELQPAIEAVVAVPTEELRPAGKVRRPRRRPHPSVNLLLLGVVILCVAAVAAAASETGGIVDAVYWSVMVCTTVGVDESSAGGSAQLDRVVKLVLVLLGVPSCCAVVLRLAFKQMDRVLERASLELNQRAFPLDLLVDLDSGGRGVNKLEFLCAALMALDKVTAHELRYILDKFRQLDIKRLGKLSNVELAYLELPGPPPRPETPSEEAGSESLTLYPAPSLEASPVDSPKSVEPPPSPGKAEVAAAKAEASLHAVVTELYQDALEARARLGDKDKELMAAMLAQRHLERALQQALAERQSLYGEVQLLQQVRAELEERAREQQRLRLEVRAEKDELQRRCSEAEHRCQDLLARLAQATESAQEGERKFLLQAQLVSDLEARVHDAERRSRDNEEHSVKGLQDAERRWRVQAEAEVSEARVANAEMEMRQKSELQCAILELQALSQGQQELRSHLRRVRRPPRQEVPARSQATLITGDQPWEAWHRVTRARAMEEPRATLLNGRVREHVDLLDSQLEQLGVRASANVT